MSYKDPIATYEEARRCPKCNFPGEVTNRQKPRTAQRRREGAEVHIIWCRTPGCRWENTSWVVQVNADGTVPIRPLGPEGREFPKLDPAMEQRVMDSLNRQVAQETQKGGGELGRR